MKDIIESQLSNILRLEKLMKEDDDGVVFKWIISLEYLKTLIEMRNAWILYE